MHDTAPTSFAGLNGSSQVRRFAVWGTIAGALSALVFTAVHDIFISNIWFSLIPMLIAGAVCGLCLGWTYGLLFDVPTTKSWLGYNGFFVALFALLGAVSVIVLDPITTVAEVLAAGKPPSDLVARALPLNVAFTMAATAVLSLAFGRKWLDYVAILVTCILLMTLLGQNVSLIGLVFIPGDSMYLVAEMFVLIFVLNAVFAAVVVILARKTFVSPAIRDTVSSTAQSPATTSATA